MGITSAERAPVNTPFGAGPDGATTTGKRHRRAAVLGQAIRFGIVGVANTLVGLGVIYGCLFLLGWSDSLANITGYTVGLIQSFALNRAWTFRSRARVLPAFVRFLAVFAVSYGLNLALVLALRRAGVGPAIAHAAGMPVYTLVFFVLSRWFVFAQRAAAPPASSIGSGSREHADDSRPRPNRSADPATANSPATLGNEERPMNRWHIPRRPDPTNSVDTAQRHARVASVVDRRPEILIRAIVLIAPVLAFFAMRLPTISQNGFTDAMYYLGYANNFADLVDRYGFIYYAVRFGPIFTEMAFAKLFAPLTGFLLLRYLLAVTVAFLLHAVLAERYGRKAALLGVMAWTFNPVTARILLSTYVDATSVPMTMIGLLLLIRQQDRSPSRSLLAGALLCAGVSGNLYAGVMIALGLPAYLIVNSHRRITAMLRELAVVLAGAALTLGVFTGVYDRWFGVSSLIHPALAITKRLAGGESKLWTRPAEQWLIDSPHLYAPFLILIAVLAVWHRSRDRLALATAVYLTLFIVFYWVSDLFFDGYSLSFYPYFSYWQGALMLGTGVTSCLAFQAAPAAGRRLAALSWGLALAGPPVLFGLTGSEPPAPGLLAIAGGAALLLFVAALARTALRPVALIGLIGTASLLQSGSWVYNAPLGKARYNDRELVKTALQLIDRVPKISEDGKDLRFWYSPGTDRRLTMIQSVYLPFSRLRRPDGRGVETPRLAPEDIELLKNPQLGHLLIMDFARERVDAALEELSRAGVPHVLAQRLTLGSRKSPLDFAHVILRHPDDPVIARYDATAISAGPQARIRYDANGATLTTGTTFFNWDGVLNLRGVVRPERPVTVSVDLQVLEGRLGLALIRRGQPDLALQENLAAQTRQAVSVAVRAENGADVDLLAFRNWMEDGTRTIVRIRSITIHQDASAAAPTAQRGAP